MLSAYIEGLRVVVLGELALFVCRRSSPFGRRRVLSARRLFWTGKRTRLAGALLFAGWLVSCAAQPSDTSLVDNRVKLDVCTSSTSATQLPVVYALEKRLFAKYGLDVTLTQIDSGSRAVAALVSGSVQICQISGPAAVNAAAAGADLAIVGGLITTNAYSLMVSSKIESFHDLKGKAVAVSTPGSSSALAMTMALKSFGLRANEDVAILSIGGQTERMAAMDAGYVVGTLADPPETILARERGYHVLLDMSAMNLPYQHNGTVTTRSFINSHRLAVLNYMKAITEAVFLIKRDRNDALTTLSKLLQFDRQKQAATLEETYDVFIKKKFEDVPYPSLSGIQVVLDATAPENPNAARMKPEDVVDLSIVRELEQTGFLKTLLGGDE